MLKLTSLALLFLAGSCIEVSAIQIGLLLAGVAAIAIDSKEEIINFWNRLQ